MISRKMSAAEAIRTVRMHRDINPNEGFIQQLADLDNELKRERLYYWLRRTASVDAQDAELNNYYFWYSTAVSSQEAVKDSNKFNNNLPIASSSSSSHTNYCINNNPTHSTSSSSYKYSKH